MPPYIVDFLCLEAMLIVEVDGGQHAELVDHDASRTAFLEKRDFRVLHFWNNAVFSDAAVVLESIAERLGEYADA